MTEPSQEERRRVPARWLARAALALAAAGWALLFFYPPLFRWWWYREHYWLPEYLPDNVSITDHAATLWALGLGLALLALVRELPRRLAPRNLKPAAWSAALCAVSLLATAPVWWYPRVRQPAQYRVFQCVRQMPALGAALERYRADHGVYPPSLACLTSPVGYVPYLPRDPLLLRRRKPPDTFDYISDGSSYWMLRSIGPDQDRDLEPREAMAEAVGDASYWNRTHAWVYEPRNGTYSSGDIVWIGGDGHSEMGEEVGY